MDINWKAYFDLLDQVGKCKFTDEIGHDLTSNHAFIELKKSLKHHHIASASDIDFCDECGANFRNIDVHKAVGE